MASSLERRESKRMSSTYCVQEGARPQASVELLASRQPQILERASPLLVHLQERQTRLFKGKRQDRTATHTERISHTHRNTAILKTFENVIVEHQYPSHLYPVM